VVYLGHGNGFPSPYATTPNPYKQNGMGLNATAGAGDSNTKYYGEAYIGNEVNLAANAVVILNHLCYASGNSEPGHGEPSVSVAHKRIDNYGAGFIRAGARAVIAEGHSGAERWIRLLFTSRQSIDSAFRSHPSANENVVTWPSTRSSGFRSYSDPDSPAKGFYRAMVADPDLITSDAISGTSSGTAGDPSDFVVPGAASVGAEGAELYADASLGGDTSASPIATLAADDKVRVVSEAVDWGDYRVLEVETLDLETRGFVDSSALVPRDSIGPLLGSVSGIPTWFSPNDDGIDDDLSITGGFSEPVSWVARIRDGDGKVVHEVKDTGESFTLSWDGRDGSARAPDGPYTWSIWGSDGWGNTPVSQSGPITLAASLVTDPKLGYVPTDPVRLLDSRYGTGLSGAFAARSPRTVQIAGRGGIPAGAKAVTLNLTVVGSTGAGYVSLTPTPTTAPTTSTINFPKGDTRANGVTVPLGPGGKLSAVYMSGSGARTHLLMDVTGYFVTGSGALYTAADPVRLLDSRFGNGLDGPFRSEQPRTVQITGRGGVPAAAKAVTINLTVVGQTSGGWASVTPTPIARPDTSIINFPLGDVRANGVTVPLGPGGTLSLTYVGGAGATTHLIVDVTGYFLAGDGGRYVPASPSRLLDSRFGTGLAGPFEAREPRVVQIAGRGGIPADAKAVTLNLTVVGSTAAGYVSLTPTATTAPTTSTINFPKGDTRANGVTVPLGPGGTLAAVYIAGPGALTHLLIDVTGYSR
jgi:hypothetical protein